MALKIHSTAIVDPKAQLSEDVTVGAYAYIGGSVKLGSGTIVEHHATVDGNTEMGEHNHVHPYAFIGAKTHDLKYKGGETYLKIGHRNVFREYTSIHTATNDGDSTVIKDDNYFLAFVHLGHDCRVGNNVIVSACTAIGGHVQLDDYANVGGNSSIHQFCRIGTHAMLGAHSFLKKDIPPFMLAIGVPAVVKSFNKVGMERRGFSLEEREWVKRMFKCLYQKNYNRSQAFEKINEIVQEMGNSENIRSLALKILEFSLDSARGLV